MALTLYESSLRGFSGGVHFFRTEAGAKLFRIIKLPVGGAKE